MPPPVLPVQQPQEKPWKGEIPSAWHSHVSRIASGSLSVRPPTQAQHTRCSLPCSDLAQLLLIKSMRGQGEAGPLSLKVLRKWWVSSRRRTNWLGSFTACRRKGYKFPQRRKNYSFPPAPKLEADKEILACRQMAYQQGPHDRPLDCIGGPGDHLLCLPRQIHVGYCYRPP